MKTIDDSHQPISIEQTICLNMIVKNESHIIESTLKNILEHMISKQDNDSGQFVGYRIPEAKSGDYMALRNTWVGLTWARERSAG